MLVIKLCSYDRMSTGLSFDWSSNEGDICIYCETKYAHGGKVIIELKLDYLEWRPCQWLWNDRKMGIFMMNGIQVEW
jgi:hypothetical protein